MGMAMKTKRQELPPQLRRAGEQISETLSDIARGNSREQYPALDGIFGKQRHAGRVIAINKRRPWRYCPPQRPQRTDFDPTIYATFITDIYPAQLQRITKVEDGLKDLHSAFNEHKKESVRAAEHVATHGEVEEVEKRLDRDFVPRLTKLESKRWVRDWGLGIALTLTLIYSVIQTYDKIRNFIN